MRDPSFSLQGGRDSPPEHLRSYESGHGPLIEHLRSVEIRVSSFNPARYLGIFHDIGKISSHFLPRLQERSGSEKDFEERVKFRHPTAALPIAKVFLDELLSTDKDLKRLLLFVIYTHHTEASLHMIQNDLNAFYMGEKRSKRLKSFSLTNAEIATAFEMAKTLIKELYPNEYDGIRTLVPFNSEEHLLILRTILEDFYLTFRQGIPPHFKDLFADLYSTLIEADWEAAKDPSASSESFPKDFGVRAEEFLRQLKNTLETKKNISEDRLNDIRDNIQRSASQAASSDASVFFLSAPTGSGKTEAALFWALERAKKRKERNIPTKRLIFVLPFKALIEDQYERLEKYFGRENISRWDSDAFLFLLRNLSEDSLSFKELNYLKAEARHFLKAPIILTTADQVLMAFMSIGRYAIKKGIIQNSILVFDEIHGYDGKMRLLIYSLASRMKKVRGGGSIDFLFMSATLPPEIEIKGIESGRNIKRIFQLPESSFHFILPESGNLQEWVRPFSERKKKVHLQFNKSLLLRTVEETSEKKTRGNDHSKSLVNFVITRLSSDLAPTAIILNTIEKARNVYRSILREVRSSVLPLREKDVFLLHSELLRKERESILREISKRIRKKNEEPFILVSTQVVEVGVDLSFKYIFRELAPLDSLIQAAGRVNRDGSYEGARFIVFTLNDNEKSSHLPYGEGEYKNAKEVLEGIENINSEEGSDLSVLEQKRDEVFFGNFSFEDFYAQYLSFQPQLELNSHLIWSVQRVRDVLGEGLRDVMTFPVFVPPGTKNKKEAKERYIQLRNDLRILRREKSEETMYANRRLLDFLENQGSIKLYKLKKLWDKGEYDEEAGIFILAEKHYLEEEH